MNREEVLDRVQSTRMIAILRGEMGERELEIVAALLDGGISAVEVSIVSRNYAEAIRKLALHFGSRAAIGAGTVLTVEALREVADCGASFIVSPNTDPEVIKTTRTLELASFPGAYTATEIVLATRSGADAVKVFPAVSLGPGFLRALRGPLPGVRLIPTGGIGLHNMASYFSAGAWAVGIGSELVGSREFENLDAKSLTNKARRFIEAGNERIHV